MEARQQNLVIIIPCYNEYKRWSRSGKSFKKAMSDMCDTVLEYPFVRKIVFVDDGSSDNTLRVLQSLSRDRVGVLGTQENHGKGSALNNALSIYSSRYKSDIFLFMDADLSVPLSNIQTFYNYISYAKYGMVIASRYQTGSKLVYKPNSGRSILSKLSRISTRLLLGLDYTDTQCGFKMFYARDYDKIAKYIKSERWLFDVELLMYMQELGVSIKEVPVTWGSPLTSTLNGRSAVLSSSKELLGILLRRRKTINEIRVLAVYE